MFFFYLFSTTLIISAVTAVSTRNLVHSSMFLILAFLNAAVLMIMIGAEFVGLILIMVYVGAIAVLFLFVVMMIDTDAKKFQPRFGKNFWFLFLVFAVILIEVLMILKISSSGINVTTSIFPLSSSSNTQAIGKILYTNFALPLELAGAILLVAMIGAISLPLRKERPFVRKQDAYFQSTTHGSVVLVKPEISKGIDV